MVKGDLQADFHQRFCISIDPIGSIDHIDPGLQCCVHFCSVSQFFFELWLGSPRFGLNGVQGMEFSIAK